MAEEDTPRNEERHDKEYRHCYDVTILHRGTYFRCSNIVLKFHVDRFSTLCSKKRDHVFDDKLKYNCPFTKIFGTVITKDHRPSTFF